MGKRTISDLIHIAKLRHKKDKQTGKSELYLRKIKSEFLPLIPKMNGVFLIYKDHRVRYEKMDVSSQNGEDVVYIRDEDTLEEILKEQEVIVAIDKDTINEMDENDTYYDPIDMKVIWNDTEVATIKDFFYNGAHYVYELEINENIKDQNMTQHVLIPDVEAFVIETDTKNRFIKVVDLDQFLYL